MDTQYNIVVFGNKSHQNYLAIKVMKNLAASVAGMGGLNFVYFDFKDLAFTKKRHFL
jgi:hypothetical protein